MKISTKRAPLYQSVEDALRQRIQAGEWRQGEAFPSRREICEIYKISSITATRVLGSLEKEGVIERVQGRGNFYRGMSVPVSRAGVAATDIAIIAPRRGNRALNMFFDGFYSLIADQIVKKAHENNRDVRMAFLPEEGIPDSLQHWLGEEIAGFIFFGVSGYCDQCAELARRFSLPAVFVDSYLEGWTSIVSDNAGAALQLVDKLLEAGHRRVGYAGSLLPGNNLNNESERLALFPTMARAKGIEIASRIVSDLIPDYSDAGRFVRWIKDEGVTAVVCSTTTHCSWLKDLVERELPGAQLEYFCLDTTNSYPAEITGRARGTAPDLLQMGSAAVEQMESLILRGEQKGARIVIPMLWNNEA